MEVKVATIIASQGEYSDHTTWVVKTFVGDLAQTRATQGAEELQAVADEIFNSATMFDVNDPLYDKLEALGDSWGYIDYTGRSYHTQEFVADLEFDEVERLWSQLGEWLVANQK